MVRAAHSVGAITLIDAAHRYPISGLMSIIGCGFNRFLGHKMCGPTGIGVLYGKRDLLESMPPFLGGEI